MIEMMKVNNPREREEHKTILFTQFGQIKTYVWGREQPFRSTMINEKLYTRNSQLGYKN
jgi:hypothetical protein